MASLQTAKETRLGDTVTQSANATVPHEVQQAKWARKCKAYTGFTAKQVNIQRNHVPVISCYSKRCLTDKNGN